VLNQDRFEADVLGSAEPVLVDFFGTWCPPCKEIAPTIDKLAQDGYRVCKVNVDDHPDLARRLQFGEDDKEDSFGNCSTRFRVGAKTTYACPPG
jgi:thiol-disulfide isomerase/thioredoxin